MENKNVVQSVYFEKKRKPIPEFFIKWFNRRGYYDWCGSDDWDKNIALQTSFEAFMYGMKYLRRVDREKEREFLRSR